jgi:orotidine-5'-phosphate decarboxylase
MVMVGQRLLTEPERLIVALDVPSAGEALRLVDELKADVSCFKIGLELFCACGPDIVKQVAERGVKIFLDLKFHDIPNTVRGALQSAMQDGVFLIDVHASGGRPMLEAAVAAVKDKPNRPHLLGITVLTHLAPPDLREVGQGDDPGQQVVRLAQLCKQAGLDGVVCSPQEIKAVRDAVGPGFWIVTPGIRPAGTEANDQTRIATPTRALRAGASFLVIGRPITAAPDPRAAAQAIVREMKDAMLIA